jgi:putative transcriptional regulator
MRHRGPRSKFSRPALAGSLLLAHPSLRDPNFRHTVVLLSAHDGGGAMGVVLNRPLTRKLGGLGGDFAFGPLADVPLFAGGPVKTEELVLCAWQPQPEQSALQIVFGLDPERAAELHGQPGVSVRGFLGHAGWSGGQLESELKQNAWVVCPVTAGAMAGETGEPLWRGLLGGIDHEWRLLADEPDHPEKN